MTLIKLTTNHFINCAAVVRIAFDPKAESGDQAVFTVVFTSDDLLPLYLHGVDAEEAFVNWTRLYDGNHSIVTLLSPSIRAIQNEDV